MKLLKGLSHEIEIGVRGEILYTSTFLVYNLNFMFLDLLKKVCSLACLLDYPPANVRVLSALHKNCPSVSDKISQKVLVIL